MFNDGGGEHLFNIIGEFDNYTIGIGAPDSDSMDQGYSKDSLLEDMNKTKYFLPYDTLDINKRGFMGYCIWINLLIS